MKYTLVVLVFRWDLKEKKQPFFFKPEYDSIWSPSCQSGDSIRLHNRLENVASFPEPEVTSSDCFHFPKSKDSSSKSSI